MTNKEIAAEFFRRYQQHDHAGMRSLLHPDIRFDDMAFHNLRGEDVAAMWRWFCLPSARRKDPVDVPAFAILKEEGDAVHVEYRVRYTLQDNPAAKRHEVDYQIQSTLVCKAGKIVEHRDQSCVSEFAFARMALGFPRCLAALTPFFRPRLRKESLAKLEEFKRQK